jgi:hypothetical protein
METPSSHWVTIFATLLILTSTLPLISIPATATTQDTIECHSPRPDIPIGHSWSVDEDDANVNATIRQINGSQIQYTYHDLEPSDAPYGPFFPTWMVDAGIRVDSAQGFDVHRRPNSISLTWNTSVTNPSFTLTTTRQRSAGVEDAGFAIQPEWAFVPYPNTAKTNYSLQTSQQGYTGDQFALLGRYDKYQREIGCHDIELIIPSALDTKESPSEIADSLETAGREIDAGWYYDTVRVFGVGPPVRRGGRAYNHEVWANVDASFEPEHVERGSLRYPPRNVLANTWLHEYVHTRQRWITNTTVELNASWLTEASATYYSIAETERQGRMIACNETAYWTRLNKSLTFGENSMELTERESYQSRSGDYTYGASVLAALDAKLREETNGERSLEDVLSQLNQQEQVTHASFRDTVVDVGGQQMGPWVDRYVAGGGSATFAACREVGLPMGPTHANTGRAGTWYNVRLRARKRRYCSSGANI